LYDFEIFPGVTSLLSFANKFCRLRELKDLLSRLIKGHHKIIAVQEKRYEFFYTQAGLAF